MTQEKNINCKEIHNYFPDFLTDDLAAAKIQTVRNHTATCEACRKELDELTATWTQLGVLEEEQPSPNLRKNFYTMLESYKEGLRPEKQRSSIMDTLKDLFTFPLRPAYAGAFAVILLIIGFAAGYMVISPSASQPSPEPANLQLQVQQLNAQLAVAQLAQDSPGERLKGIARGASMKKPDPKLLDALLHTLNNDSNVNVRLSAVDALYLFSHHPTIKEGLIDSLEHQKSPLVQVALIDLLSEMREKRAADALKKLIQNEKLNPAVKERAQNSIKQLI